MRVSTAIALRAELLHHLKRLEAANQKTKTVAIRRKLSVLDTYLKSLPPLMPPEALR